MMATDKPVTAGDLWDKLDRVEQRIGKRIDDLGGEVDGAATAIARIEADQSNSIKRINDLDGDVEHLKRSDKIIGIIGAVMGPAVASFLAVALGRDK